MKMSRPDTRALLFPDTPREKHFKKILAEWAALFFNIIIKTFHVSHFKSDKALNFGTNARVPRNNPNSTTCMCHHNIQGFAKNIYPA